MVNEKIKILIMLIENREESFSIRKISKIRKINYKSAYNALKQLEEEKIITLKKVGNTTICSFKGGFNETVFLAEHKRREDLLKNKNLKILYNKLGEIPSSFIILLFGSQAGKTSTKHSDIDLLIIGGDKEKIRKILSLFSLNIHPTFVTYDNFINMAKSREFTVVSEAIKRNIILIGIEEYYRLLKNAG